MKVIVLDVETSGLPLRRDSKPFMLDDFEPARIIELAYVVVDDDHSIVKEREFLLNDTVDVLTNSHIHGIQLQDLKTRGVPLMRAMEELYADLQSVDAIVAHNLDFDLKILLSECYRERDALSSLRRLLKNTKGACTMLNGKRFMDVRKWPKLVELYEHITGERVDQTHRAMDDVKLCYRCFVHMQNTTSIPINSNSTL
jgi:DNA polymerase III epsilon subunit-like protein